jgi:membrane-associated protease RseP (regulator of RpoE activity)
MRRLTALLIAAGFAAAPIGAVAGPSQEPQDPRRADVQTFSWSSAKPRLGVMITELTPELRTFFGAPDHSGVLIGHVEPGSPAARAGILVGDVMIDVRGHSIDDAWDVRAALAGVGKGQVAAIKLVRDRKPQTVQATLTSDPAPDGHGARWSFPRWLREWMPPLTPDTADPTRT